MVVSAFIGTLHLDSLDLDVDAADLKGSVLGLPDLEPGHGQAALPELTGAIITVLTLAQSPHFCSSTLRPPHLSSYCVTRGHVLHHPLLPLKNLLVIGFYFLSFLHFGSFG